MRGWTANGEGGEEEVVREEGRPSRRNEFHFVVQATLAVQTNS